MKGYIVDEEDMDFPDYEDFIPPSEQIAYATSEQIAYANSLVGKWVESKESFPYYPFLGRVVRVNDYSRGGNPSQIHIKVFRARNMWEWLDWKLMWHSYDFTEVSDSAWMVITNNRPTIKNRLSRFFCLLLRTPVRMFLKERFNIRTYGKYSRDIGNYTPLFANLYAGIYDVFYWMKHGYA